MLVDECLEALAGGDGDGVVVPDGDVGGGEVAAAGVAVAAGFQQLAVVLAGGPAGGGGDDVVDVAAVDRVAVGGGVLTDPVSDFDGAT